MVGQFRSISMTETAQAEVQSRRVEAPDPAPTAVLTRGLHSFTFRLDMSTLLWYTLGGSGDKTA